MYIEINSVDDLLKNISLDDTNIIFRGQANIDWKILPAIARFNPNDNYQFHWNTWTDLELDMVEMFKKKSIPFISASRTPTNHFDWLVLAQHHGMPTRLLDWTTNPLKALFFAVENVNSKDDGLLVLGVYNGWWNQVTKAFDRIDEKQHLMIYFPDDSNVRIASQEGCFTVFPLPENMSELPDFKVDNSYNHDFENLTYFRIPNHAKTKIRSQLRRLGVSHHSIYPGLDGLCTEIRRAFMFSW
ncbi:FRG domain-containing protein [Vibrio vulnificus]|uniref:FRG domain-containing protein n=1 Tax=Vibrio vulnificus TaxID=672 RepID=UPI001A2085AA|nr:FRG domain-containing protein [Vibrio vulnificus]MDK2679466.1 FRG domain-containing protein [Vibrio vulnificus]MDK2688213.1 FRG domain-containing protein [Vibrio vulnificus]HAS8570250.1 FRG domain-containing protein [Vibrio vulnificus]